ncbi:MAG: HD domain-containing protein [Bdellovibrionales bacterium]|nr:HD domain-containing protein [Bdellovibrionales bacterium]
MATKSFLSSSELEEGLKGLQPTGLYLPPGQTAPELALPFSQWLEERLLQRMCSHPEWAEVGAVALGSWARGELSPRSDVDILLTGDEQKVFSFASRLNEEGVKLRYRVPEDPLDWMVGVEPFDVLAVLHARALHPSVESALAEQKQKIKARGRKFSARLMQAMRDERRFRNKRYDSISNYLEPNLKYGPGGLRDLQQALYVHELYPHKFETQVSDHSLETFAKYRQFFLTLRWRLHLMGRGDAVPAGDQIELAQWFGYENLREFMREIQLGLGRVSFYADWMVERARATKAKITAVEEAKLNKLLDGFPVLEENPSRLMQGRVRAMVEPFSKEMPTRVQIGKALSRYLSLEQTEEFLVALFKSRLLEFCVPELSKVAGLVQHDQYHRYTVNAHLLQAIRVLHRIYRKPSTLGRLKALAKEMTDQDWQILIWTALYHDLAKGRGGNHSIKGATLVKKDLVAMKVPLRLTVETAWMVEHHLDVSTAAFRMNPHAKATWQRLHEKGIKGDRLRRLVIFTAVDIQATNPEAWSEWKERLLMDLYDVATSKRASQFMELLESAESERVKLSEEFIRGLDPALIEEVPVRLLIQDYQKLKRKKKSDLETLVWRSRKKETWVRLHARNDRPGLFLEWTGLLFASGCQIQQCAVQTYEEFGAYDWFKVKSSRTPAQLKKWMSLVDLSKVKRPEVFFDQVTLVSQDDGEDEVTLSFRGKDRPGLLMAAASALAEEGFTIKWARAFTWGRQVDDVFGVKSLPDLQAKVESLAKRLTKNMLKN